MHAFRRQAAAGIAVCGDSMIGRARLHSPIPVITMNLRRDFAPGSVAAVAFDHDGTLVNSIPAVVAATNATLIEAGFAPVSAEAVVAAMPLPTGPRLGSHAGLTDPREHARLAELFYRHAHELAPTRCQLYPGVAELLPALTARGIPMAVVSNNEGALVRKILGNLGILHHFTTILGEEDMPAPKPDPRGLLRATERMQREAFWCVFVGDSHPDSRVAHNAGMRSIGVTWGIHPRAEMADFGFDALVDTPDELLALLML
jgi:phosphoglycolate phosphatase